jgi:hypothetical protein
MKGIIPAGNKVVIPFINNEVNTGSFMNYPTTDKTA